MKSTGILSERELSVFEKGRDSEKRALKCGVKSVAGSVSQRACVFCGSRVVLYPVADALHIVHGPVGCASFTWDIRGSVSSGPQLHKNSFSTDLRELDVVYGGEKKLYALASDLIRKYSPKAAFVYSTCIAGLIGDDVESICARLSGENGIPVIPVSSEGFKGTKKDGYKAACEALFKLTGTGDISGIGEASINILGEFNLAGEAEIIKGYYSRAGIEIVSVMTGDGRVEDIKRAHGARLNVVQCSGSMTYLAKMMEEKYKIPFIRVSYFGMEDTAKALYDTASFFKKKPEIMERTRETVKDEINKVLPEINRIKNLLEGKKAALYVGGAFKAFSLVKALRMIGVSVVLAGSQTGNTEDYETLKKLCDEGTVIVDDSNPREISKYMREKGAEILIGGVKERPIAYKLGVGFCDHNHERKIPLAGFVGMLNFAKEVESSLLSPVFRFSSSKDTFMKGRR